MVHLQSEESPCVAGLAGERQGAEARRTWSSLFSDSEGLWAPWGLGPRPFGIPPFSLTLAHSRQDYMGRGGRWVETQLLQMGWTQ